MELENPSESFPPKGSHAKPEGRLFRVKNWENVAEQAGYHIPVMAVLCSVSTRQLERHFKAQFNLTPTRWLRELRCRRALEMIAGGFSTKAAAAELKFATPSHFCHEFRKVFGKSPQMIVNSGDLSPIGNNVANKQSLPVE